MPRLKNYKPGRRVNIWLPNKHDKIAKDIDNLSEFFQQALEQAAGIMAFDIIKKQRGITDTQVPTPEELDQWNKDHPLDPLTLKRKQKCNTQNSVPKPELW